MILSVSRRTDVPRFYYDWFLGRLREGYALVRSPMNPHAVSRVDLGPDVVDCIVFWTKDPSPMLGRLEPLSPYPWYIQYTLHNYGREIECALPALDKRLDTFYRLSEGIGPQRVVWRYSPVLLSAQYTPEYHVEQFGRLAKLLGGYTDQCKMSFLEIYRKIENRMRDMELRDATREEKRSLSLAFEQIAAENGITLSACGNIDLKDAGLPKAHCVDAALMEALVGQPLTLGRGQNQRPECYCAESIDIGAYDSCCNGCVYCYANHAPQVAAKTLRQQDPTSPILGRPLDPLDKVTERGVESNKELQTRLF